MQGKDGNAVSLLMTVSSVKPDGTVKGNMANYSAIVKLIYFIIINYSLSLLLAISKFMRILLALYFTDMDCT